MDRRVELINLLAHKPAAPTGTRLRTAGVITSWYLTNLLHHFPDQTEFDLRIQENELEHLASSDLAMRALCDQYIGLPYPAQ